MTSTTSLFCGKCHTHTRLVPGRRGRICPRCHPDPKGTGIPCHDGKLCRPERCAIGLDCKEGKK
jgi:hypothetical protein